MSLHSMSNFCYTTIIDSLKLTGADSLSCTPKPTLGLSSYKRDIILVGPAEAASVAGWFILQW